ncbi:NfeD family protein [Campylobacter sp. faydin G-24]|uniref:NfeD family protein n=1 Tax=Campylobacter anatolicus TaxID=2829105 RepID=A0ABS5HJD1_9BACT|nr:NfeD family protein [Campylobacter anatolicus]MBR8464378.1 NfeD family protein [Campylobacter anatolicus]
MIDAYFMLAIGVVLMVMELALFSFYLLFFGLGFFIVGVLNFIIPFSWQFQILVSLAISLVLLVLFKNRLRIKFDKKTIKEDFLDVEGIGVIKGDMLYYKGTFWHYDGDFKDEEQVKVLKTSGNKADIQKI